MKKNELVELRKKGKAELLKMVNTKKLELTRIMGKIYAGKEKNLKKGWKLRREIAQVMTVMKGTIK